MPSPLSQPKVNLAYAAAYTALVLAVFALGYRLAGWSWGDAIYMVVITAFSVGFGEVHPVIEPWLRLWTMALIVLGCTGIIFITGTLVQFLTESQIQRALGGKRMETEIDKLNGHTIICGFGRIGRTLALQLADAGAPFLVLDQSVERVAEARERGWLALQGEATDEEVLRTAGIDHARVLATVLPDDAKNVFITLSARNINKDIQIIARGEVPSTERKLIQAGANRVVLPAHISGDRIAHLILHPNARELLGGRTRSRLAFEHHLTELGVDMEEIEIGHASPWVQRCLGDFEREASEHRQLAIAILRASGEVALNPAAETLLQAGDAVVVMKRG